MNPKLFSSKPIEKRFANGFATIYYLTDAFNPTGRAAAYVRCEKHGEEIPVELSMLDDGLDGYITEDAVLEALKKCSGCQHIEDHKTSRFPEGAEL